MILYLFIATFFARSAACEKSPFTIENGCPVRNRDFDFKEVLKTCEPNWIPDEWLLAMCPCSDTDCQPWTSSPADCGVRGCAPTNPPTGGINQPVEQPSLSPIGSNTAFPTFVTTIIGKITPAPTISKHPSVAPSENPSAVPSGIPSGVPSLVPSSVPSAAPSEIPSTSPTWIGTKEDHCPQAVFIPN